MNQMTINPTAPMKLLCYVAVPVVSCCSPGSATTCVVHTAGYGGTSSLLSQLVHPLCPSHAREAGSGRRQRNTGSPNNQAGCDQAGSTQAGSTQAGSTQALYADRGSPGGERPHHQPGQPRTRTTHCTSAGRATERARIVDEQHGKEGVTILCKVVAVLCFPLLVGQCRNGP